jgi:uncharacterized iron-regulated membrane protein
MRNLRFLPRRSLWRQLHLWIALCVGLLVVPIGLTGTLLVVHDEIERWIDPEIHAVSGTEPDRALALYIDNAAAAVPGSAVVRIRFQGSGAPVTVLLRGGPVADALQLVYLDPPTGRVLGVRDFRGTFVGLVHGLHGNLLLPAFNGRAIVGWVGVTLFVSALTGLVLWWPRKGGFLRGLGWRRGILTSVNLHNMFGAWICLPLAFVAATGVTLGFPDQTRAAIGMFAATTPRSEQGGKPLARPSRTADAVAALALAELDGARVVALASPTERSRIWRVQLERGEDLRSVTIDDTTGKAVLLAPPGPGDSFATTLRRLHEGELLGPAWRWVVFATGLAPLLFLVTGLVMWRRRVAASKRRNLGIHAKVVLPCGEEQDAPA